jgi:hypothetical protein
VTHSGTGSTHAASRPLEPEIESLPLVGKTWYRRGPAYWIRRVLISLFFFALAALDLALIGSILLSSLNSEQGRAGSAILFVLLVVVGIATGRLMWGRLPPGQYRRPSSRSVWGSGGAGAAMGILLRAGPLAGFFILFGSIFTAGPLVVLFLRSFPRVLYGESEARKSLEAWYHGHGRPVPWHGGAAPWDRGTAPRV